MSKGRAITSREPARSSFNGRWHLVETDLWGDDSLNLLEQAYIELRGDNLGSLVVGALQADLDHRTVQRDDQPIVEFSWIGDDDLHPASGRGSARLDADGTRHVKLYIHRGDEATMVNVPIDIPEATGARASKPGRRGERRR